MNPASGVQSGAWLLIALPLISSAILLVGGRRTDKWGHLLGAGLPSGSRAGVSTALCRA